MDPTTIPIRDIHLPDPIAWWPPAPGWWLVLLTIIGLAVYVTRRLRHRRPTPARQRAMLRSAIREHWRALRSTYASAGPVDPAGVREVSAFLRRVALSLHPRESVAGLSGEAWLGFLDQTTQGNEFRQGIGRLLLDAPYRPGESMADTQWQALVALCDRWVEKAVQAPDGGAR